MYADDMVLASTSKTSLQITLDSLTEWAQTNDLTINGTKIVTMNFKRGGKQAAADTLYLEGRPLNSVKDFKYLGITLQPQGKTYTVHIKDKVAAAAAIIAMTDIKHLSKISLQTAMKIFKVKILPVITYGLNIIWQHLKKSNLKDIEKIKSELPKACTMPYKIHAIQISLRIKQRNNAIRRPQIATTTAIHTGLRNRRSRTSEEEVRNMGELLHHRCHDQT